jgi:retron-type reverse transcriptase
MRRAAQLFDRIIEPDNLLRAFFRASRGKRGRAETREFAGALRARLKTMAEQVCEGTFRLGRSRQFVIHDPKRRIITAPCFEERVLHHAIMNVCEPVFERWLIHDTYACRVGKGRLKALARAQAFSRRFPWFLKLDVRHYFDSVPHELLIDRLRRLFKDRPLLELLERIVRSHRATLGVGLPIGSLTSQHFANFYLGWFDRFAKEDLQSTGYVRYMDDMVIWCETSGELRDALARISEFLSDELRLTLKPTPYWNRSVHGVDFLGVRVLPSRMVLNRRSRVRFRRKLHTLELAQSRGEIGELEMQVRATSLVEFTQAGGVASWNFRRKVLKRLAATVDRLEPG